jgi:predicted dehydrogenase
MRRVRRIKIACVGTNGHQIFGLLKGLKQAQLVGVTENAHVADYREAFPGVMSAATVYFSLDELLAESDCDLVSLCSTRRDQQAKQILACLATGRHVLAEKPLCTSLEDLAKIRRAAKKARRKVWAMLAMVNVPILMEMQNRIRKGEFGEVGQVFAQKSYKFGGNRPQDRGVDGGIIQAAIHAVSFIRSTTGLEFTEVSATESAIGNKKKGNLQVEFAINARLSNGALCQIITNYLNPDCAPWWGNDQLRVFGTRGMIETVDGLTKAAIYVGKKVTHRVVRSEHPNYLPFLLNEIATGKPAHFSMEDSFRCTQIVLEAQLSATANSEQRLLKFLS